jgi:hypothetical protein
MLPDTGAYLASYAATVPASIGEDWTPRDWAVVQTVQFPPPDICSDTIPATFSGSKIQHLLFCEMNPEIEFY